jgi:acetoin utilization deacetylase AcuC-like enzyme
VVHSPSYEVDIGPHVFPTTKYALVRRALVGEGWLREDEVRAPEPPSDAELLRVHTAEYLADLRGLRWTHRTQVSELPVTREIVDAYVLGAGGTTVAGREALEHGTAVHLGGGFHHAFADHAEGFCYVNDLAVAIRTLQHERRITRAAVVDVDVHQGNGTAHLFEGDPSVFTVSLHQEWNYPSPKMRSSLDVGLADRTGDEEYLARLADAVERVWEFGPDLVLVQAGADPYRDDQLGGLSLTMDGLDRRDRMILEGCASRGVPSVVTLGGGYARRLEDTVEIHSQTCRAAFRAAGHATQGR